MGAIDQESLRRSAPLRFASSRGAGHLDSRWGAGEFMPGGVDTGSCVDAIRGDVRRGLQPAGILLFLRPERSHRSDGLSPGDQSPSSRGCGDGRSRCAGVAHLWCDPSLCLPQCITSGQQGRAQHRGTASDARSRRERRGRGPSGRLGTRVVDPGDPVGGQRIRWLGWTTTLFRCRGGGDAAHFGG